MNGIVFFSGFLMTLPLGKQPPSPSFHACTSSSAHYVDWSSLLCGMHGWSDLLSKVSSLDHFLQHDFLISIPCIQYWMHHHVWQCCCNDPSLTCRGIRDDVPLSLVYRCDFLFVSIVLFMFLLSRMVFTWVECPIRRNSIHLGWDLLKNSMALSS